MPKIFISFSSKEPDGSIANSFNEKFLAAGIETFFAPASIEIGEEWATRIEEEINSFDYFLVLLSKNSKGSDMVVEEIRKAKRYFDKCPPEKKPGILPIRVLLPMNEGINYDVDAYLQKFQQRLWEKEDHTQTIFNEIIKSFNKGEKNIHKDIDAKKLIEKIEYVDDVPTPVAPLVVSSGAEKIDSPYYVIRKGEKEFMANISQDGALLRIFAPRQFGKTSLLSRIIQEAKLNGHHVASISLQSLEENQLTDLNELLTQLCVISAESAERSIEEITGVYDKIWASKFDKPKRKCDKFFENYLLQKIDKPLIIAIDEADRLFEHTEITKEFFGLLRVWNEQAKTPGKELFKKLKIIVSYSTEAFLAIPDIKQSPFNIGIEMKLNDFTQDEVKDLAGRHGLKIQAPDIQKLYELIGGHPFMVRRALYLLASKELTLASLFQSAALDDGPFYDLLKRYFWYLDRNKGFTDTVKEVVTNEKSNDVSVCMKLRAAGLISGDVPNVKMKYKLYQDYFKNKLLS